MKKIHMILFGFLFLGACNKPRLEGDSAILLGEWKWSHTYKVVNTCNPPSSSVTLSPLSEGTTYFVVFENKRDFTFIQNGEQKLESKITDIDFTDHPNSDPYYIYTFAFTLENTKYNPVGGLVGADTLILNSSFPFQDTQCENYSNYFVRE
ncbi:MAG: hypothetical protein WDZ35_06455 [Crocinitomicaceae bacterium]